MFPTACINVLLFIRYIGENYSQAQELMEDQMREFYQSNPTSVSSPSLGQLVAVRGEEEDGILRAQISEVMADKVKVGGQHVKKINMNENKAVVITI